MSDGSKPGDRLADRGNRTVLALEVENIVKRFADDSEPVPLWQRLLGRRPRQVAAVRGVSFQVPEGEIFGILGPNGSGKSTLIRVIATLLLPDEGTVRIFGHDVVRERTAVRQLINRVSVEAAFFKKLSAMENLMYAARLYGLPVKEATARAGAILDRLGLPRKKRVIPLEELSRGQQQKVAIARALMTNPRLLLLDEPTTGLDPKSKREVQDFILEAQREHGATVILTSHDMEEAERLCQRVAFMDEGRFVALGTPGELKAQFGAHPEQSLEAVFLACTGKGLGEEAGPDRVLEEVSA
ncbi:MAG: ABC transporter ATP-binding protein [Firmicutes bacterium]|nr:ABC transporter ATP-binding protein [Bacillota bacterium]